MSKALDILEAKKEISEENLENEIASAISTIQDRMDTIKQMQGKSHALTVDAIDSLRQYVNDALPRLTMLCADYNALKEAADIVFKHEEA